MKEIKFNAVNESTGKYVRFDDFIKSLKEENGFGYIEFRDDDTPNELLAKFLSCYYGFALLQYTGIKDRNGVEIYEGDILHFISCFMDVNENVEVIFENAMFKFVTKTEKFIFGRSENYSLEVIGNIYENKREISK